MAGQQLLHSQAVEVKFWKHQNPLKKLKLHQSSRVTQHFPTQAHAPPPAT